MNFSHLEIVKENWKSRFTSLLSRSLAIKFSDPLHARFGLAALFLVAKRKLSEQAGKKSNLCKKTWGIQP